MSAAILQLFRYVRGDGNGRIPCNPAQARFVAFEPTRIIQQHPERFYYFTVGFSDTAPVGPLACEQADGWVAIANEAYDIFFDLVYF